MVLFLIGIVCGILLSLVFGFGPAFFTQIQASVHYGFRTAKFLPIGILLGDFVMMFIIMVFVEQLPPDEASKLVRQPWFICTGALLIALYGLYLMLAKTRHTAEVKEYENVDLQNVMQPPTYMLLLRGVFIAIINPAGWIYWVTLVSVVRFGALQMTFVPSLCLYCGVLSANFLMDLLKCKLASLLRRMITYQFLKRFNVVMGAILIALAIAMAVWGYTKKDNPEPANSRQIEFIEQMIDQGSNIKLPQFDSLHVERHWPHLDSSRLFKQLRAHKPKDHPKRNKRKK